MGMLSSFLSESDQYKNACLILKNMTESTFSIEMCRKLDSFYRGIKEQEEIDSILIKISNHLRQEQDKSYFLAFLPSKIFTDLLEEVHDGIERYKQKHHQNLSKKDVFLLLESKEKQCDLIKIAKIFIQFYKDHGVEFNFF